MDEQYASTHARGQASVQEKIASPLRRSCEACRASKGRCCPSKDDAGRCQRCLRDRKQCVFLEAKPRPKRVKTSRTRVAEMEQKLNGIFAMLSASNVESSNDDALSPDFAYLTPSARSDRIEPIVPQSYNVQEGTSMSSPWLNFDEPQDVIRKGLIPYNKAEALLRSYKTQASNFPFIIIPETMPLDSLRREKPFLLLSILTVTSNANQVLQNILEAELRETLGRKVIFNGEKSLDLMQGLLIYLTWYYQFFTPERQQIYQLSQLVIAMAVDLEISRPGNTFSADESGFVPGDFPANYVHAQRFPSGLEAMRAFLGCYYLSSYLSIAFRKPNNLKYTDYVELCCQTLANATETSSDSLLPYFIRIQRLAEEISITFDYGGCQQLPELDAVRIEMFFKTFRKQLKQLEETIPLDAWQNDAIRLGFLHLKIYLNEISLHTVKPEPVKSISDAQSSCREWYYAVARTDALVACVESAKEYMDDYLKLPTEKRFQNTIMEEMKLIYAVFIMGRFTSGVDSPFLDASYLRETAKFSEYMSALIERLNGIVNTKESGREQMDYFWHLNRIFKHTKIWFGEQIQCGVFTTLASKGVPDCLDFNFMDSFDMDLDAVATKEPEMPEAVSAATDHLWTVAMLEAWPTSNLNPWENSLDGCFHNLA